MREVPEVLVADLAVLAVGAAQQVRRVQRPVLPFCLDCGYVSRTTTLRHTNTINHIADRYQSRLWLHPSSKKKARPPQTLGIGPQTLKNFRLRCTPVETKRHRPFGPHQPRSLGPGRLGSEARSRPRKATSPAASRKSLRSPSSRHSDRQLPATARPRDRRYAPTHGAPLGFAKLVVTPASSCPCEGVQPTIPKSSSTCSARMEGDDGCQGCGQTGRDRR